MPNPLPINGFKAALAQGRPQIGCWLALADAYAAEIMAGAGFDWLLIDGEHAPNTALTLLSQLQALAAYPVHAVVRPAWNDPVLIKQVLDLGATTLLVPMIDTAAQAAQAVAAVRYPPLGIRGVGSALARASRWNRIDAYVQQADTQMCLLVQLETPLAIANLEAILAVDGVDGAFIGPADLSAALGHRGNPTHPEVQALIDTSLKRIVATGKAAGILSADRTLAAHYLALGTSFVAVGADTTLLARSAEALAGHFKAPAAAPPAAGSVY